MADIGDMHCELLLAMQERVSFSGPFEHVER